MTSGAARDDRLIAPVVAMIDSLPHPALVELERALAVARQSATPPPRIRHQSELAFLASLLAEAGDRGHASPRIPRKLYDAQLPKGAPLSHTLVRRHGSWVKACRAAASIELARPGSADAAVGQPWRTPSLGRRRNPDYTRDEVISAVLEVARRIGCDPSQLTSNVYYEYVAEVRRRAQRTGATPPRWPTQRSVERFFKSWEEARAGILTPATDESAGSRGIRYSGVNDHRGVAV